MATGNGAKAQEWEEKDLSRDKGKAHKGKSPDTGVCPGFSRSLH